MNRRSKKAATGNPPVSSTSTQREPLRRPSYDDGRCGGWLGPAPGSLSPAGEEAYWQYVKDTDR